MFEDLKPHLFELRKRLAISAISVVGGFFVMFYFHEALLEWMVAPLNTALIEVGKKSLHAAEGMVTTSQVGGAFFVALKVAFFAGLLFALPVVLSQIWLFVAPGLYANEKKMILPFVFGGTTMFAVGVAFAYYVVTPFGFDFLITFGSFKFTPLINIEDYVGFFTKIMFGFGIAFELPVFAYFLGLLGLVDDRQMTDFFKYAVVIIFVVAALLTPPDVLTQLLMAIPLIILYGVSILLVRMVNPAPPEEKEAESENANDDEDGIAILKDALGIEDENAPRSPQDK
jgi:sec-independent protein translocase protein TatC